MGVILITDKPGQTGNQLWAYVNFIALAQAARRRVILLLGDELTTAFKKPDLEGVTVISKSDVGYRLWQYFLRFVQFRSKRSSWNKIFRILGIRHVDGCLRFSELQDNWNKFGLLMCESWPNRVHKNVEKLGEYKIRNCFVFQDAIRLKAAALISQIKADSSFLVGVHIGRGDYKTFLGGRYFYDDDVYLDKMKQIRALTNGRKVAFVLCSNTLLQGEILNGENVFYFQNNCGAEDMCLLSGCDIIMGPPSTFSMWSSYYGKTPLNFIEDPHKKIVLSEFRRVVAQDVFEQ